MKEFTQYPKTLAGLFLIFLNVFLYNLWHLLNTDVQSSVWHFMGAVTGAIATIFIFNLLTSIFNQHKYNFK